jgi:hypothetical protein
LLSSSQFNLTTLLPPSSSYILSVGKGCFVCY